MGNLKFIVGVSLWAILLKQSDECQETLPESCSELLMRSNGDAPPSGKHWIKIKDLKVCADLPDDTPYFYILGIQFHCCVEVYCDMETMGGGWTVFQNRFDGSVDFFETWSSYEMGFGDILGEFWMGNILLNYLTNKEEMVLMVDLFMEDKNCSVYRFFNGFNIGNSSDNYRLTLASEGQGNLPGSNSLLYHNGEPFTTRDKTNNAHPTANCAVMFKGAWWYKACHSSNLNGLYHSGCSTSAATTMTWSGYRRNYYSHGKTQMKFRSKTFSDSNIPTTNDAKFCTDTSFTFCPKDCYWSTWEPWTKCKFSKQMRHRSGDQKTTCYNYGQTQTQEQRCVEQSSNSHFDDVRKLAIICSGLDGAMIGSSCYFLNQNLLTRNDHWDFCEDKGKLYSHVTYITSHLAIPISSDVAAVLLEYINVILNETKQFYLGGEYTVDTNDSILTDPSKFFWMKSKTERFVHSMEKYNINITGDSMVSSPAASSSSTLCLFFKLRDGNSITSLKAGHCDTTRMALCQLRVRSQAYKLVETGISIQSTNSDVVIHLLLTFTEDAWECGKFCSKAEGCQSFLFNPPKKRCILYGFKLTDKNLDNARYNLGVGDSDYYELVL